VNELFPDESKRFTFTYSFTAAMQMYIYDGDVELFYKILFGSVSEQCYYDQISMIAHLKTLLESMDVYDGTRNGKILQEVFFPGLRAFFPVKAESSMAIIRNTVLHSNLTSDGRVDIELVRIFVVLWIM
jgi:hypothetical protein